MFTLRSFFFILILMRGFVLPAQQEPAVAALSTFISDPEFKHAGISFYAMNLKTREVVAQYQSNLSLTPASVTKLVTTGAAIMVLGANHRFVTTLAYDGKIVNGELQGNLYIIGGGDPALGSPYFNSNTMSFLDEMAAGVTKAGITHINGKIIADDRLFPATAPANWAWGDLGNYYGASASGLSVFDNTFEMTFRSGKIGDTTKILFTRPAMPLIRIRNEVVAASGTADNAYIFGAPYTWDRTIRGSIPANKLEFVVKGSLPDPALVVATLLKERLLADKIAVAGDAYVIRDPGGPIKLPVEQTIAEVQSVPLWRIIRETNLRSVNPYAESLLGHVGLRLAGSAQTGSAASAITSFWVGKGVEESGLFINDGSGLSRSNAFSAAHLVKMLHILSLDKNFQTFYESLAVAGRSGTMSGMLKGTPAENNLRGKSGYMTRVRSYAGYVKNKKGEEIAFAFLVNNYDTTPTIAREKMEKVMAALAE